MSQAGPFGRLARWVAGRPVAVLLVATLTGIVAALIGLPPRIDTGDLALFPPDHPQAAALIQVAEEAGGASGIHLSFEGDDPAVMQAALDELATQLAARGTVRFAFHRLPDEFARHATLMQLDPEVMESLAVRVDRAMRLGPALNPIIAATMLNVPEVTAELERAQRTSWLFPDDGLGRVFVKPEVSEHDAREVSRVVGDVDAVLARNEAMLREAGVRLKMKAGPYVNFAAGIDGVRRDLGVTSAVSAGLVLVLLMVGFRSVRAPLLVLPPILLGTLVNLAVVTLAFGAINTYTSVGTAVLIGLGIDVAIHLLGKYRQERAQGHQLADALALAWDSAGPPCTTAAFTSAAGFLALSAFRFKGLSQLGICLAFGLIACLVAIVVLLPALISVMDRSSRTVLGVAALGSLRPKSEARAALARLGLSIATAVTLVVAFTAVPSLRFNYDITAIGRDHLTYSLMDETGRQRMREALPPVVVTLDDASELPAEHARLRDLIERGELESVHGLLSMETLLPHDQPRRVRALTLLREASDHPNARHLPAPILEHLATLKGWEPRVCGPSDLPPGLNDHLLGGRRILLLVHGDLYDMRESSALLGRLLEHVDDPASGQLLQGVLLELVFEDLPWVAGFAFLAVALLVALDLRNAWHVIAVLGALLAGLLWAATLAALVGLELNLANIVGLPILVGIGIDVVVHLVHRLRTGMPAFEVYRTVGVAALLSTLTTVASFVALTASGSGGTRSLGLLIVIGLPTVTCVSALVLWLAWTSRRRRDERPGGTQPVESLE